MRVGAPVPAPELDDLDDLDDLDETERPIPVLSVLREVDA
jgi:hypothetical protein